MVGSPILWCPTPVGVEMPKWIPLHPISLATAIGNASEEGDKCKGAVLPMAVIKCAQAILLAQS